MACSEIALSCDTGVYGPSDTKLTSLRSPTLNRVRNL
jgi:hypothetical protein